MHKAPEGMFIVGEAFMSEDEWSPIGEPYGTLAEARERADALNAQKVPDLSYFVYDENGLVKDCLPIL